MEAQGPNAEQIQFWNAESGGKWALLQDKLDAQIGHLGAFAMDALSLQSGASVLDVGCGCGTTTFDLARRVGSAGRVVGVDISRPMLARAREIAARDRHTNVAFEMADAQTFGFPTHAFDAGFSRFGVMFFADPTAAFANVRSGLKPGGTLAFVCWRGLDVNDWARVPAQAVATVTPLLPRPDPFAPGPFAFANGDRTRELLMTAGFRDVSITSRDDHVVVGATTDLDEATTFATSLGPAGSALRDVTDEVRQRARVAVRAALEPLATPDGVRLRASVWVVRATA